MTPVYDRAAALKFIARHYEGPDPDFERASAIGVADDHGRLVAGVAFTDWDRDAATIQMSAASITPQWLNRSIMRAIGDYVFRDIACQLLWMRTSERNAAARRMFSRIGGREFEVPRLLGRDCAAVFITLTAEQWAESRYSR